MISKTISITIPDKLEKELQLEADEIGISRSRFIGNILLDWQEKRKDPPNECTNLNKNGYCDQFGISCMAPQSEAITCEGYNKPKINANN